MIYFIGNSAENVCKIGFTGGDIYHFEGVIKNKGYAWSEVQVNKSSVKYIRKEQ